MVSSKLTHSVTLCIAVGVSGLGPDPTVRWMYRISGMVMPADPVESQEHQLEAGGGLGLSYIVT